MWIKEKTNQLKQKYNTSCPYQLANHLKIHVMQHDLHHEINGYYKYDRRNQYIVINSKLEKHTQKVVCAHELGHALFHKNVNTPFMSQSTFLSVSKIEREANCFAAELLIPDESFSEYETIQTIASLHKVPIELVELKCEKLI
ncbi:ImmA/IrrE family metallo-endopeptidase [Solibacillus sp. A46]|uniref:ImmA/IrrE family metallo-endopeptidase n=1 Tax=Solibacillus faecavium TaxID=2762221 RepID=A0ABR8XYU7_9BACL|nr:ImmA/IrrE family metallo-endopeptidase [Solibacillus faecavium]MBD8037131.1 ImmA/IrrE family metallo-endopeptidase [Solibacillus faecavium]